MAIADGRQCVMRQAGLMPSDDDVWKRDEALKDVIGDDLAGEIAKEEIPLLFVHVDSRPAWLPGIQRVDGGLRVDQPARGRLDSAIYTQGRHLRTLACPKGYPRWLAYQRRPRSTVCGARER